MVSKQNINKVTNKKHGRKTNKFSTHHGRLNLTVAGASIVKLVM